MVLPEKSVRPIDLYRLERGVFSGAFSGWDPRTNGYEVVVVEPGGIVRWRYQEFEASGSAPWNRLFSNEQIENLIVFVRPLPGTKYGEVVQVLDWLRTQVEYGSGVLGIDLVSCEEGPEAWDPWDVGPSTEPIRTMLMELQPPRVDSIDIWIPPPPESNNAPSEVRY